MRARISLACVCLGVLVVAGCNQLASNESAAGQAGSDAAMDLGAPGMVDTGGKQAQPSTTTTEIRQRAIIRTGSMTIRTNDPADAAEKAEELLGGEGYVGSIRTGPPIETRVGDRASSVDLELRVPVEAYDSVVSDLKQLGKLVDEQHEATDVTKQLTDVESRLATQRASIERLRTLMSRADTIGQVVQVESELTIREADLESLQSQYATLSAQTALSTLHVRFQPPPAATEPPPKDDDQGFFAGLAAGWGALGTATQVTLTAIGAVLPFLVVLLVLAIGPYVYWRQRRSEPTGRA